MVANMALNLALIFPLKHAGLALATSLSAYLNAFLLMRHLRRDAVYLPSSGWSRLIAQVAGAALLMAGLLAWLSPELGAWSEAQRWTRVVWLGGLIMLGAATYGVALLTFGLRPRDMLDHSAREID